MKLGVFLADRSPIVRFLALAALAAIALLWVPEFVDTYHTQLLTYGLVFGIAALGFNLLLGYTGLLSFGHSAYLGAGAYSVAFMVRYLGVSSLEIYIVGGILGAALISALFGYVCVRHTKIFFAILTLALSQVLWTLAYKFFWVTGGTDGIRVPFGDMTMLGGLIEFSGRGTYSRFVDYYYYYVLAVFFICVVLMWVIVQSPFGKTLQAIRDNEIRARFLGVRIRRYRWFAFLVSGTFTGLAGVLLAPMASTVEPDGFLWWPRSGEIVFFTVLGGFRTFTGPIVGAVVYNFLHAYAVAYTDYWQLVLGLVLVTLVLALPMGIVGTLPRVANAIRARLKREAVA